MPQSMTGFSTAERVVAPFQLTWEVRSVNHRFLDLGFRIPDELRHLEPELRDIAARAVNRGKVDCVLKVSTAAAAAGKGELDTALITELRALDLKVRKEFPDAPPLAVGEILRWPGLLRDPAQRVAGLAEPARACFGVAVEALRATRAREGARIADSLEQRRAMIGARIAKLRPALEGAQDRYRQRLKERVARFGVELPPERLEQEIALVAQRADVMEEVERIDSHLAEVREVLTRNEPIGRRLDFLIQELNREANTFASKVQEEELTRHAVELKVIIEQMREQVQNLE
jgi:uncharacterized protein (TIGR00255 family)